MKKNSSRRSAFFYLRFLLTVTFCLSGIALAVLAFTLSSGTSALAERPRKQLEGAGLPDSVAMVGPFSEDRDLHDLPQMPANQEEEETRLMRYRKFSGSNVQDSIRAVRQAAQVLTMPAPSLTFPGMSAAESGCGCLPPDTDGDVGPNHYIQSVNSSIKIYDKAGNVLLPATTYNSFFSGLAGSGTACGLNQNDGDGIVFYDHVADRWVVSDFAFTTFPGPGPFYQCIGVSKTSDPVAGGWWLYAVQVDPANTGQLGDYPKFGMWHDAWYMTVNLFSGLTQATETFNGVRVFAFPRAAMINGTGAPNTGAVAFTITPAGLGDSYSLVPASFRTGSPPPAGTDEYLLAIDSPSGAGVVQTKVHAWRFHVDFANPANSTLGVGVNHTPNADITVDPFVDAYTSTTNIVPQPGTTAKLDTLGDKLMTPLVYQNRNGTESLWVSHTINNNQGGTGPTAIRWYQFNVTGNTIPATPAQQQTFNGNNDGVWRWMPSIAVDGAGNMAIGYTASSDTLEPSIRWAGRLAADAVNTLGQGEATMTPGGGHQTSPSGRWGDYSYMSIDPKDNLTFWHTNEYYAASSGSGWNTSIGKFRFSNAPVALSAVSRKTHGGNPFDINLPLTGNVGIEDRQGPVAGQHQIIATMNAPVTVASASASPAPATVSNFSVSGSQVTINLSGVPDPSRITVTLNNVNDSVTTGNVSIPAGFLLGDTNADSFVNAADATVTRNLSGQAATANNFRSDFNSDGTINAADATTARNRSGQSLPP
ncbi:MAG: dockerin type I domain-containing protein [Chthoniobacterales bacterium]